MAARRGKTQARRGGGMKYGVVLMIGLLLGLALAGAYMVFGDRRQLDALLPTPDAGAEAPRPGPDSEPAAQEPQARPTFDFYTVLPGKEVELPGQAGQNTSPSAAPAAGTPAPEAAATVDAPASTAPAAAVAAAAGGQLQAGAFSNAADAEALRARLALVGQVARIESVRSSDGRTLHRVRLGPYASAVERDAARQTLAEAGISSTPAR